LFLCILLDPLQGTQAGLNTFPRTMDTCIFRIYSTSRGLLARWNLRSGFKHGALFCGR